MNRPRILGENETIDTLASVKFVAVRATALRPGMILIDPETDTPGAVIDHRMKTVRNSGSARFLILDLDARRYEELDLGANSLIRVAV